MDQGAGHWVADLETDYLHLLVTVIPVPCTTANYRGRQTYSQLPSN